MSVRCLGLAKQSMAVLAFLMLAFYLLPNTAWVHFSPLSLTLWLNFRLLDKQEVIIICLASVVIWVAYKFLVPNGFSWLWALVGVYISIFSGTALLWYSDRLESSNCSLIIAALCVGLAAAAICPGRTATFVVCAEVCIQSCYALYYQHIGINHVISGDVARAGGTFNEAGSLYLTTLIGLMLCVGEIVLARTALLKALSITATALVFAALLITWYRSAALAAAISIVYLCYKLYGNNRRLLLLTAAGAIILCLSTFQLRSHDNRSELSSFRSVRSHIALWLIGAKVFNNNWISGVGAASLQIPVVTDTLTSNGSVHREVMIEPKSEFLLWMDEVGLIGGLLFASFVCSIVAIVKKSTPLIKGGIASAWLALGIISLFDAPFGTVGTLPATALVGTLMGITMKEHG